MTVYAGWPADSPDIGAPVFDPVPGSGQGSGSGGTLPRIFNTGIDALDALGNAYFQLRALRLQEKMLRAPAQQEQVIRTVEVPQNVGAEPQAFWPDVAPVRSQAGTWLAIAAVGALAIYALAR